MKESKENVLQTLELFRDNWPDYWDKIVPEVLMFFQVVESLEKTVQNAAGRNDILHGDFEVLFRLRVGSKDGVQTPTELYTKLGLSSGGLTKILKRLSDKELIVRFENPDDKRSLLVKLTGKGERLLGKTLDDIIESDQKFFACLESEERSLLQKLLKKLLVAKRS